MTEDLVNRPPLRKRAPVPPHAGDPALIPFNLRQVLQILRRQWWLVLGVSLAGTGIAAYAALSTDPRYQATAVIRLGDARRALTGDLIAGPAASVGRADPLLSQLEVVTSRAISATVVDSVPILRLSAQGFDLSLLSDVTLESPGPDSVHLVFLAEGFEAGVTAGTRKARYGVPLAVRGMTLTVERPTPDVPTEGTLYVSSRDGGIDRLLGGLSVSPRENTDVVDVTFTAADPERAQQVVNRVVAVFQVASAEAAQQQSRRRREFVEEQLRFNDSLLAAARSQLSDFRTRAYQSGARPLAASETARELEVRHSELDAERRMYRELLAQLDLVALRMDRSTVRRIAAHPGIASHVEVSQLYGQLMGYEAERDVVSTGPQARPSDHPDVLRLDALVAVTEKKLAEALRGALNAGVATLDARLRTLDELRSRSDAVFRRQSVTEAEEARLIEQVEASQRLSDQLREEYQHARIAEAAEVGQVEILDLASIPGAPTGVGLLRKLIFGLLAGLLLGGGATYVLEHLGTSIRHPGEVEALGLPVLGVVPHFKDGRNGRRDKTAVPVIEAIRGVRLNLVHAYGAAGPLVVTMTSPGSREGKSFVTSNLGVAFSQAGYRTVVIDGDVRCGELHRLLGGPRKPGLTDYLHGSANIEEIVRETRFPSLAFLSCGTRTPDAPELLSSPQMSQLMTWLRSRFNVILVDTPPMGAGIDAFALGAVTGQVLVVVRLGQTNRDLAEVKLDVFDRLPVRMLGTVLNDVRFDTVYGHYRHHSYHHEGYELPGGEYQAERELLSDTSVR